MFKIKFYMLLWLALGLTINQQADAKWQLLYKHSKNGTTLPGNKQQLFDAIRSGLAIRVVWKAFKSGNPDSFVEHVIEPEFITNASDQNVFVQTPEHIAQTSYWDTEFQDFSTATIVWRGLLSTTGRFMAVWYNWASDTESPTKSHHQLVCRH